MKSTYTGKRHYIRAILIGILLLSIPATQAMGNPLQRGIVRCCKNSLVGKRPFSTNRFTIVEKKENFRNRRWLFLGGGVCAVSIGNKWFQNRKKKVYTQPCEEEIKEKIRDDLRRRRTAFVAKNDPMFNFGVVESNEKTSC